MSKTLLVLVFCISAGCGEGESGLTGGTELSSSERTPGESKDADAGNEQGGKTSNLYVYRLPKDVQPHQVSGLEVVLRADSPPASEGYYVELFAVQPGQDTRQEPRQFALGGRDVFKPLKQGETTTVFLEMPPKDAWVAGKCGQQLKLVTHIKPAHPQRDKPDVTLHIVGVKVVVRKVADRTRPNGAPL